MSELTKVLLWKRWIFQRLHHRMDWVLSLQKKTNIIQKLLWYIIREQSWNKIIIWHICWVMQIPFCECTLKRFLFRVNIVREVILKKKFKTFLSFAEFPLNFESRWLQKHSQPSQSTLGNISDKLLWISVPNLSYNE